MKGPIIPGGRSCALRTLNPKILPEIVKKLPNFTMEDWSRKAQLILEKVGKQREKVTSNGHPNNLTQVENGQRQNEKEILDRLCKMLESSVQEQRKLDEEMANKRMQRHLNVYGTWASGTSAKMFRPRSGTVGLGTDGVYGAGMDAIEEDPKEDEVWRGSCQFSDIMEAMQTGKDEPIVEEMDYDKEPWLIRTILHMALFTCTICYLLLGALVFRWIDPEIGAKVFPKALVWTFQLATTIGWGDSKASTGWSQAFTVLYVLFAIPMIFAAFANLGRLATEFACIGWPRLKCWIMRREFIPEEHTIQRLPLLSAINYLCLHQSIGIFLYSHWLKQWPVIGTVYYSITTMATIGFGDYHPDTDHMGETMIALLYLSSGITLLSMLYLTIAFHFQTLHYEYFKNFVEKAYTCIWVRFKRCLMRKFETKKPKERENVARNN